MRFAPVGMALLIAGLLAPVTLEAQDTRDWAVRVRAIYIAPDASSDPSGLDVEGSGAIEVDVTRYLSPLFAVELIAATAGHEVTADGTSIGSVSHVPPTLLFQVRPLREGKFQPYLGLGGNVTFFYGQSGALEDLDFGTSVGWAGQGGFDVLMGERGLFNVDVKYIDIGTTVELDGTEVADLDVNPWVIGLGFGYRF